MKRSAVSLTLGACLVLAFAGPVFATGQPGSSAGVNCGAGSATATPGNAAASPGAPFNPGGKAGQVYAGSGANTGTPASSHAVAQYDIACQNVTRQMP